jgi:hypothetical protein
LLRSELTGVELDPDDGDEYFLAVPHSRAPWSALSEYQTQKYGLAVEITDEGRVDLPLYDLVAAKLRARATAQATLSQPSADSVETR